MKARKFLSHDIVGHEHRVLMKLINMVHLPIGLPKKRIKTEAQFWEPIERIYGLKPYAGDPFMVSVRRILTHVGSFSTDERRAARDAVGYGQETFPPLVKAKAERKPKSSGPTHAAKAKFYQSWEWRTLRMEVIKKFGRQCQCCGAMPGQETVNGRPVRIVVDHIKPLSKYWELRLDESNLQVLCDECNQGKGAWDQSDYRPDAKVVSFPTSPKQSSEGRAA